MTIELSKGKKIYLFHKISDLDIALSIRNLSSMLKSGVSIVETLEILTKQVTDELLKETYEKVLKDIQSGVSLAESMKKYPKVFSSVITSIIEVGEQGGTLEKNLIFLADYLKKGYELKRKIKGATTYPLIIIGLTVVEMIGVIYFILPKLESLFSTFKNIPDFTRFILSMGEFIRQNGIYLLAGLIILFFAFKKFLGTKSGKKFKDRVALKMPVFKKMNIDNTLATFSRTIGILLESGIPLQRALAIAQNTMTNTVYMNLIAKISNDVKGGKNLADSLALYPQYFPINYTKMIEIGESTGNLEENLNYLYDLYTEEVMEMSNNLTTLIEPLLLIFIGCLIGGLALIIITPIYQLTGSINDL